MEKELILKLKNKDNEAYEMLFDLYFGKIYYLSLKLLGNQHDAEDATQMTFLNVFRSIDGFMGKSALKSWIYKIAFNVCNDILRKRKRNAGPEFYDYKKQEYFYNNTPDEKENTEEKILYYEKKKIMYECLGELSHNQRKFIILRDFEGLSYSEISEISDTNIGTVKSGINRARIKLSELVKKRMGDI